TDGTSDEVCARSLRLLKDADALLISDYDIATITPPVIGTLLPAARHLGIPVVVDAHDQFHRFSGIHAATPNQPEAEAELGRSLATDDELGAGAEELAEKMDAEAILITRGGLGMALHERKGQTHVIPVATYTEVRDATGAGDTAATVYTLAIAAGASALEAAHLANLAAGVAVCKLGVATVTIDELRRAILTWQEKK
ncbi:MAG: PfkB family carbohydrate kinase, partial [Chloroflexi bacterium]|nr:PfkB family carbohydrate kinase [Chloroflexota bacterium]